MDVVQFNKNAEELANLKAWLPEEIVGLARKFLYAHVNTDNPKYENIFNLSDGVECGSSMIIYYNGDGTYIENIIYKCYYFDVLEVVINPYACYITFKPEHGHEECIFKMKFEKFKENYIK